MTSSNPFFPFDAGSFDFSKFLSQAQVPGLDPETLLAAYQDNVKAVVEANSKLAESYQTVAARQMEIMTEAMETARKNAESLAASGSPQAAAAKQLELTQAAFQAALGHMRELAEATASANTEAAEVIRERFQKNLDDLKAATSGS